MTVLDKGRVDTEERNLARGFPHHEKESSRGARMADDSQAANRARHVCQDASILFICHYLPKPHLTVISPRKGLTPVRRPHHTPPQNILPHTAPALRAPPPPPNPHLPP